jgi:hypothetical protein
MRFDFDFHVQGQILALADIPATDPGFGGVDVEANASIMSFGVAAGLGYERLAADDGTLFQGGNVRGALQWRFLALLEDEDVYKWVDPHIDIGGLLGGVNDGGSAWFRGQGYLGAGIDVRLMPDSPHAVLTAQYRWYADFVQAPDGLPQHHVFLGLGIRGIEE